MKKLFLIFFLALFPLIFLQTGTFAQTISKKGKNFLWLNFGVGFAGGSNFPSSGSYLGISFNSNIGLFSIRKLSLTNFGVYPLIYPQKNYRIKKGNRTLNIATNLEWPAFFFPYRPVISELPKSPAGKILKRQLRKVVD